MDTHDDSGQATMPDNGTLIKANIRMSVNRVLRNYLSLLEELADEHDEAMGKVHDSLPDQYKSLIVVADHFGEARFSAIRKRILDSGNGAIREMETDVDGLRI